MKRVILLCMLFVFATAGFSQETTTKKGLKTKTEKAATATKKAEKVVKETKDKAPLKKDGTVDKRYKAAEKAPLKKRWNS